MRSLVCILLILFSINCNFGQNPKFQYKTLPSKYVTSSVIKSSLRRKIIAQYKNAYDLTNGMPKNCDKTGNTDYTTYIQDGINHHLVVKFPNFPVLINAQGLKIKSNSKLIFQENSKILLKANSLPKYQILDLTDVSNVDIYFPVIYGDRKSHGGIKGEFGHGILISGSQNINIYYPCVSNCWGDGIYIGDMITNNSIITSNNIMILNAFVDNNRRDGISITSGSNIYLKNPVMSNSNGTNPQSGIDIEPNGNYNTINNIEIDSPITYNNAVAGIIFSFRALRGKYLKNVSLKMTNHIDECSFIGEYFILSDLKKLTSPNLIGTLNILNSKLVNNVYEPIVVKPGLENSLKIKIVKPLIEFQQTKNLVKSKTYSIQKEIQNDKNITIE